MKLPPISKTKVTKIFLINRKFDRYLSQYIRPYRSDIYVGTVQSIWSMAMAEYLKGNVDSMLNVLIDNYAIWPIPMGLWDYIVEVDYAGAND